MALIEVDIPEEEGWRDDVASRVLWLVFGGVLLLTGIRLWATVEPLGWVAAVATCGATAGGVLAMIVSISDIDLSEHGRTIGYLYVGLLMVVTLLVIISANFPPRLGTDTLAFTSYAEGLLANGINPMSASMEGAVYLPGAQDEWTYYTDGSRVLSWSYPAGYLYVYAPQYNLIGRGAIGMRLTSMVGIVLLSVMLIRLLPAVYSSLALVATNVPRSQFLAAAGGLTDVWWVLPVVGAVVAWYVDRKLLAAVLLGIAAATKQQAWAIPPFLAIWLWHERASVRDFVRTGGACAAVGLGTFTLLNLPFVLWNPQAWVDSVFTPISKPLVSTGVGLAAIQQVETVPRLMFTVATVSMFAAMVVGYWRYFDRVKWAAWIAPPAVLLWMPRSLPSYFEWGMPIATVALFAYAGRLAVGRGQLEVAG